VFEVNPKIDAKNEKYVKPGGNVKVVFHSNCLIIL
jgi:hypothetical protein